MGCGEGKQARGAIRRLHRQLQGQCQYEQRNLQLWKATEHWVLMKTSLMMTIRAMA